MTNYNENLRKVAFALFVKADPHADQNVWDMAREVLKSVPQNQLGVHKATNYFIQASQPTEPLPEWLQQRGTPVEGDPDTIIIDPVIRELANLIPPAEQLPYAYKRLGRAYDTLLREQLEIRRITEAAGDGGPQGENQRESTVDAVKRLKETVNMLSGQLQEIRQHVGGHKTLVAEVADMAKENNELRTKVNDTVEGASATKLLDVLGKFSGRTLLDKAREAVKFAGIHQARAKDLEAEQDRVRKILGASEADSWYSEDGNGYSMHETLTDAAQRVMNDLKAAEEKQGETTLRLTREIRATFADQLAHQLEASQLKFSDVDPRQDVISWLREVANKERAEKEMDKL